MTIIPIQSGIPSQTLEVDLEGNSYRFRIIYNVRANLWTMDIRDQDQNLLCAGVAMVLGANLIDQFNLGIGALAVVEVGSEGTDADANDMGERIQLVHFTEEEVENGITV